MGVSLFNMELSMNIEEFYRAIRHKDEPEVLPTNADGEILSYGTKKLLKLFKEKSHKSLFISRNLPVIFLGPIWFLYRRMYLLAVLIPIVSFFIEYILRQYISNEIALDILELCFTVYVSLFANSLYINNTRRRHAKGYKSTPSRLAVYCGLGCVLLLILVALVGLKQYLNLSGSV